MFTVTSGSNIGTQYGLALRFVLNFVNPRGQRTEKLTKGRVDELTCASIYGGPSGANIKVYWCAVDGANRHRSSKYASLSACAMA
jgi:hypothetical protein